MTGWLFIQLRAATDLRHQSSCTGDEVDGLGKWLVTSGYIVTLKLVDAIEALEAELAAEPYAGLRYMLAINDELLEALVALRKARIDPRTGCRADESFGERGGGRAAPVSTRTCQRSSATRWRSVQASKPLSPTSLLRRRTRI